MARKTIDSLEQHIKLLQINLDARNKEIEEYKHKVSELRISNTHLSQIAHAFDRLLDGVCAGMKEANLPRRAH